VRAIPPDCQRFQAIPKRLFINELSIPSRPAGSCDAPSQKGVGDAPVANRLVDLPFLNENNEGIVATLWRRGVAATYSQLNK
jgi:hypothetical protein